MAEQLDEKWLVEQYEAKAERNQQAGDVAANIPLWLEALQRMPNNLRAKECLMASYFDTDKVAYSKEIVELGAEIYRIAEDGDSFYRGQAVELLARTYAATGNPEKAMEWSSKAFSILHAREFLEITIDEDAKMQQANLRFAVYWILMRLFYAAMNMGAHTTAEEAQELYRSVAAAFDALMPLADADADLQAKRQCLESKIEE